MNAAALEQMTASLLIVEDEPLVRDLLRTRFGGEGYAIHEGEDGRSALRVLERERIDLVLTDIVMPETDGIELLVAIREKWPELPVIVFSAPTNQLYLEVARRLGADEVIEKPLNLELLSADVKRLLGRNG
ncbi:MAG: response regulator [Planctomycetota bacterium]|nr:MAG: response regulator [Planctomycetota bacterium]